MVKFLILKFIKLYQVFISPFLGDACRFYPSCSEYCRLSIEKYGVVKGVWFGIKRVGRCHPWGEGGVDLP